jgi:hypothetical protein
MGNSSSGGTNVHEEMSVQNVYQYIVQNGPTVLYLAGVCNPIQWAASDHAEVAEKIAMLTGNVTSENIYNAETGDVAMGFPATVLRHEHRVVNGENLNTIVVGFKEQRDSTRVEEAANATIRKILAWSGPYQVNPKMLDGIANVGCVSGVLDNAQIQTVWIRNPAVPDWLVKFRIGAGGAPPKRGSMKNVGHALGLGALAVGATYAVGKGLEVETRAKNQIKEKEEHSYSQYRRLARARLKIGTHFKTYRSTTFSQEALDKLLDSLVDVLEDTAGILGEEEHGSVAQTPASAEDLARAETERREAGGDENVTEL